MTIAHKTIKYLAYALAASIIGGLIFTFLGILSGISFIVDKKENNKMITTSYENINILTLNIKLSNTNLTIETGDYFKVDSNSKDITIEQNGNILSIKEKPFNSFWDIYNEDLIVYIPKDMRFDNIIIDTGAGVVNIEDISTNEISFKIGAGKSEINNLNVINKAYFKCGAGKISILDSSINNLDFDLGVGETNITGRITGISNIKTGVGSLNINFTDIKENYKILTSKGIGEINIDGTNVSDDFTYGNGNNYIKLDGGIGSININFLNN